MNRFPRFAPCLAILVLLFRNKANIDAESLDTLQG